MALGEASGLPVDRFGGGGGGEHRRRLTMHMKILPCSCIPGTDSTSSIPHFVDSGERSIATVWRRNVFFAIMRHTA